ncbi:MAG TPA: 4Fe-4S binding protein [Mariniphaga sp.]|nr:4Fe-4S binding protein [Mariniphaga sp.]
MLREIVKIDEDLCDGCGECIPNCHEGALQLIDGKARLISELMCDGLGACLGHCPQNAITIENREAEEYDENTVIAQMVTKGKATVFAHLKHLKEHNETEYLGVALNYIKQNITQMPFKISEVHDLLHPKQKPTVAFRPTNGCPGSASSSFSNAKLALNETDSEAPSELTHWPVQLHLINPAASYFKHADLLVAADCVAFAYGGFHQKLLKAKKLVIACPKLDHGKDIYMQKLARLVNEADISSITVATMEVPCCNGLVNIILTALDNCNRNIPVKVIVIGIEGHVVAEHEY